MVLFAFGGISGLVNASYNVNLVVHHTAWVLDIIMTVVSRQPATVGIPAAEVMAGPEGAPRILDRWWPWLVVAGLLILLAYGHIIVGLVRTSPLSAPGYRVW